MLHETLLILQGTKSGLISASEMSQFPPSQSSTILACAEMGAAIRTLEAQIRMIMLSIDSYNPSTYTLAQIIQHDVLDNYYDAIISIEKGILDKSSVYMGGNQTVSLLTIQSKMEYPWSRILQWALDIMLFIVNEKKTCAELISRLLSNKRTAWPETRPSIDAAVKAVQSSWLQQLKPWLLYGKAVGNDFFVSEDEDSVKEQAQLSIVDDNTTHMLITIGKWVKQMKGLKSEALKKYRDILKSIELPLNDAVFHKLVSEIRREIYHDIIQQHFNYDKLLMFLQSIRNYVLLGSSDFVQFLIDRGYSSNDLFQRTLLNYLDDCQESERESFALIRNMLTIEDDGPCLQICPPWPYNTVSLSVLRSYSSLFFPLLALRSRKKALDKDRFFKTVFLDLIWVHIQTAIEMFFDDLQKSSGMETLLDLQSQAVEGLQRSLLLEPDMVTAIYSVLDGNAPVQESIRQMVDALRSLQENHPELVTRTTQLRVQLESM